MARSESGLLDPRPEPRRRREAPDRLRWRAISFTRLATLLALLIVPALALRRLSAMLDPRIIGGWLVVLSFLAFMLYWHDKRRAIAGGWRVSEFTLHVVAALGGWPGAFLAQGALRHKTIKVGFQFTFWTIVLLQQLAAFDFLADWQYSRLLLARVAR